MFTVLEVEHLRRRFWFLIKALFLPCRQPPFCYVLTWPLPSKYMHVRGREGREEGERGRERGGETEGEEGERESLLIRILILWDQGPTLKTPFNINYFLKGPFSKYSHTEG